MKKIFFFLLGFCFFFTFCNKEKNQIVQSTNREDKMKEVSRIQNPSIRLVAFNMLNDEEKAVAWKSHLTDCMKDGPLSREQLELIKYAALIISPKLYAFKTKNNFLGILAEINYKAKELFSGEKYAAIFLSIGKKDITAKPLVVTPPPTCTCLSNIYCEFIYGAGRTCFLNETAKVCTATTSGCGIFGTSACTGVCVGPL